MYGAAVRDLNKDLVCHISLVEGSGEIAYDKGPNGLNGTITLGAGGESAFWANTRLGLPVATIDGTADRVTIPHNSLLNPGTDSFSICFWLKSTEDIEHYQLIKHGGSPVTWYGFYSAASSGDAMRFQVNDGSHNLRVRTNNQWNDGEWHHYVGVCDREENLNKIYMDGILHNSLDISAIGTIDPTGDLILGGYSTYYLDGEMFGFRYYDRVLLSQEVLQLYNMRRLP